MTTSTEQEKKSTFFKSILEQIQARYSNEEGEIQRAEAERDELSMQVTRLQERVTQLESQLEDSKLLKEEHEETIRDQKEMLTRVENDYSKALAECVDQTSENEELRLEIIKLKASTSGEDAKNSDVDNALAVAAGKYGTIYNRLNTLFQSIKVAAEEPEVEAAVEDIKRRITIKKRNERYQRRREKLLKTSESLSASTEVDVIDLTEEGDGVNFPNEPTSTFSPAVVVTSRSGGKTLQCRFLRLRRPSPLISRNPPLNNDRF